MKMSVPRTQTRAKGKQYKKPNNNSISYIGCLIFFWYASTITVSLPSLPRAYCLPAWVNDVDDHKDALVDACVGGRAVEGAVSPVAAFHGEGGR